MAALRRLLSKRQTPPSFACGNVLIAMRADNNGEGGIFSLYALVKKVAPWLIFPAMIGGAALLADGVLTPAVTVTTAVEGLRSIPAMNRFLGSGQARVVIITLVIISTLFAVQWAGTSKIGKAFGPVMLVWFSFLGVMGLLHVFDHPGVLRAFNPVYAVRILVSPYNKAGFMILGSVFLAATGAEALYSDMGHVGRGNIYASWPFVKTCLILNYLGQGAWTLTHTSSAGLAAIPDMNPFFQMLPEALRAPAVALGALRAPRCAGTGWTRPRSSWRPCRSSSAAKHRATAGWKESDKQKSCQRGRFPQTTFFAHSAVCSLLRVVFCRLLIPFQRVLDALVHDPVEGYAGFQIDLTYAVKRFLLHPDRPADGGHFLLGSVKFKRIHGFPSCVHIVIRKGICYNVHTCVQIWVQK